MSLRPTQSAQGTHRPLPGLPRRRVGRWSVPGRSMEWLQVRADELPFESAPEVLAMQSTCAGIRQHQPWVPLKLQMPHLMSLVNHFQQLSSEARRCSA